MTETGDMLALYRTMIVATVRGIPKSAGVPFKHWQYCRMCLNESEAAAPHVAILETVLAMERIEVDSVEGARPQSYCGRLSAEYAYRYAALDLAVRENGLLGDAERIRTIARNAGFLD